MTTSKDFAICEPMFFPPISFFKMLKRHKRLHLETIEYYQKATYRNRCYLPSANGIQMLSIPLLKGKNQQLPLKDVKICYEQNWQTQHFKTIKVIYKKSPFFEFYEPELEVLFHQKKEYLIDWNIELLNFILQKINLKIEIERTDSFQSIYQNIEDFRNVFINPFKDNQFNNHLTVYHQVFEEKIGFQPDMSVIDLLFAEGSNAQLFI